MAVAAGLVGVVLRVRACTTDELCVFADGSLRAAVFGFVYLGLMPGALLASMVEGPMVRQERPPSSE